MDIILCISLYQGLGYFVAMFFKQSKEILKKTLFFQEQSHFILGQQPLVNYF